MATQKSKSDALKKSKQSARQKKIRLQQVIMAVIGIVIVVAMMLALVMNY